MRIHIFTLILFFGFPAHSEKKVKGTFHFHGLENRLPHKQKLKTVRAYFQGRFGNRGNYVATNKDELLIVQRMKEIDKTLSAHESHDAKIPYTLKHKAIRFLSASGVASLKFPSQYKFLDDVDTKHPLRNTVHAKIYYGLKYKQQPTQFIIMLPHTNDSIKSVETLAETIVASSAGKVSVAILWPPLYGKRGLESDKITVKARAEDQGWSSYLAPKFLVPEYEATFHNMAQTTIDIYTLQLFLKQWTLNKTIPMGLAGDKMSLGGPSLGGILALGYGGLVGGFDQYFALVGGSNIPLFLDTLTQQDKVVRAITETFNSADWTFKDSIQSFLPWDPLLWAHRIDSQVFMVNACNDEFLDPKNTVLNFQEVLKENGQSVSSRWTFWGHNPANGSLASLYFNFIYPLGRFAQGQPVVSQSFHKKCH